MLRELLLKCKKGFFVEFGARNGIEHSNTAFFEKELGWTGMLFEADSKETSNLRYNRPGSIVFEGAVCPKGQDVLNYVVSRAPGWSGAVESYEPSRRPSTERLRTVKCWHLPTELRNRHVYTVDYMTIDTEGSEMTIVEDFPWREFDVKVVQIEQLDERAYPAQKGKKERIIRHMTAVGYQLLRAYTVAVGDTEDLIFVPRPTAGSGPMPSRPSASSHAATQNGTSLVLPSRQPGYHGGVPPAHVSASTTPAYHAPPLTASALRTMARAHAAEAQIKAERKGAQ